MIVFSAHEWRERSGNETTPYKEKNTWRKFAPGENRLAPGANLACSGNGLASDASSFIYFFALNRTLAKLNLFIIIRDK